MFRVFVREVSRCSIGGTTWNLLVIDIELLLIKDSIIVLKYIIVRLLEFLDATGENDGICFSILNKIKKQMIRAKFKNTRKAAKSQRHAFKEKKNRKI